MSDDQDKIIETEINEEMEKAININDDEMSDLNESITLNKKKIKIKIKIRTKKMSRKNLETTY